MRFTIYFPVGVSYENLEFLDLDAVIKWAKNQHPGWSFRVYDESDTLIHVE
jgi:hypothetical protein